MEARDYYREAIIYVEDLVDARRKERNDLLIPLYSNLAQAASGAFFGEQKRCYGRCGNIQVFCVCVCLSDIKESLALYLGRWG